MINSCSRKMASPIAVMCVMVFARMTTACLDCAGGYYATVQPAIWIAPGGHTVNFTCFTNLPAPHPLWNINGNVYDITNHPPSITFKGTSVEFQATETSMEVLCFFIAFIENSVVDICSQTATVLPENIRGRRDSTNGFCECTKENVTFSNDMEVSNVHIAIEQGGNCEVVLNFSTCVDPENAVEAHAMSVSNTDLTVGIDSIEMFYGHNVTVTMNDTCDDCRERFYIPHMNRTDYMFIEKGTLIDDLSNDYGCDFGGPVVDYKICIYSGESNDCFATPCGNGHIYTSLCSDSPHSDGRVSLEVISAKNGTIVSIFCPRTDCKGIFSNVMLFNIGIWTCENCSENAECIQGTCVCKESYVGNGLICEKDKSCSWRDLSHSMVEENRVCGSVSGGGVCYSGDSVGSVAVYFCDDGYTLEGDTTRECLSSGFWNGSTPQCVFAGKGNDSVNGNGGSCNDNDVPRSVAMGVVCGFIFGVVLGVVGVLICWRVKITNRLSRPTCFSPSWSPGPNVVESVTGVGMVNGLPLQNNIQTQPDI